MLFGRLRKFREDTRIQYEKDHRENMEPWKKHVMELHEKAAFLFYFDDAIPDTTKRERLLIQGELVKGSLELGGELSLYDGQGELLGKAFLKSEPEEKEMGRKGLLKKKRNECYILWESFRGMDVKNMEEKTYRRSLHSLEMDLSLITNVIEQG